MIVIQAFYQGGMKMQANLDMTADEVEAAIFGSHAAGDAAKLKTIPGDRDVVGEHAYLRPQGLCFYAIYETKSNATVPTPKIVKP